MATAVSQGRFLRIAPRKARLVADQIRGKTVEDARDILHLTGKKAAPILTKILDSAVANAEDQAAAVHERIDPDEMIVRRVTVDEGPTLRRFRAAPRGRAVRIRKRTSHITVVIGDTEGD